MNNVADATQYALQFLKDLAGIRSLWLQDAGSHLFNVVQMAYWMDASSVTYRGSEPGSRAVTVSKVVVDEPSGRRTVSVDLSSMMLGNLMKLCPEQPAWKEFMRQVRYEFFYDNDPTVNDGVFSVTLYVPRDDR